MNLASVEDLTSEAIRGVAHRAIEYYYEQGWTDGLPVVPPVREVVDEFIAYSGRDPSEVVAAEPHLDRACTVELAAINAVMAGCLKEYFPIVLAAVEGGGTRNGQSTGGFAHLVIVNGPIRNQLGFNSGGGILGPGFRPNATIGRALRLITMNALGIRPHEFDQSTQGSPSQHGLCIAENEELSPWAPLHVDKGFAADANTVTVGGTRAVFHVENRISNVAEQILLTIADSMSYAGVWHRGGARGYTIVMGPVHAEIVAGAGFSKQDVKQFLWEHFGRKLGDLRALGPYNRDVVNRGNYEEGPDDHFLRWGDSPGSIQIVVGGAANAGMSAAIPSVPRFTTLPIPAGKT